MKTSREELKEFLDDYFKLGEASLIQSQENTPFEIIPMTFDLSEARTRQNAFKIVSPYRSIYVASATDTATSVSFVPDSIDSYQGAVPLYNKDSLQFELQKASGYIYWDQQIGKTITLVFFVRGTFNSGTTQTQLIGGSTAGTFETLSNVTVSTTATVVLPSDTSRVSATLYNSGSVDCYIGSGSVTSSNGILVSAGERVKIDDNTGLLYAITASGSTTIRILKES